MHGSFGELQMSHLAHLTPTSSAVSAGARTVPPSAASALQRSILGAHGMGGMGVHSLTALGTSPMEQPHAGFQLDAGVLRKRQRTDDVLAQGDNMVQADTLAQDVLNLGSDDGHEHGVLSAGLSNFLGSSIDGGSLDGGSLGNGSDAGYDGRGSENGAEEGGSMGHGGAGCREDQPPHDWFT